MAEYYAKGKTNWLKLILIYLVIGGLIYYAVYYFVLKPKGIFIYNQTPNYVPAQVPPSY